jgi:hypothetical protein
MTRQTILDHLKEAVPQFEIDPTWMSENLTYPAFNDFARYICAKAAMGDQNTVHRALAFLEQALHGGDTDVRDLVLECVETLNSCDNTGRVKESLGAEVQALWVAHFPAQ